jgi:fructose-1,6-bisphosphatase II / sedoheptulose-1,7-bisphosphatase
MSINRKFIDQFVDITSKASLASYYLVGKKDKIGADKAA